MFGRDTDPQGYFHEVLLAKKALVKRPKRGYIKHDYLVPGGPYEEHWDWDGFFIGMGLAQEISSEAIYLKNWCLNYLEHIRHDGLTPGLLTPSGIDKRLHHIKPFLAQGCYFASNFLEDFSWIVPYWERLKKSVGWREKNSFDKRYGLGSWYNGMESGADNNVSVLDYPPHGVIATDLNAFLYREYTALALIARGLKNEKHYTFYLGKASELKKNIMRHLWDKRDGVFYNIERKTGLPIKRVSYSSFMPLWGGIASYDRGRKMIARYLLNPKKLWAQYGIRTLAADDPQYNQANIIKPYSNWQGPVWPLVNCLATHILVDYGFAREAQRLALATTRMCFTDIKKTGGMHENYHAETGRPLAAPNFVSWNLLIEHLIQQAQTGVNPFRLPAL